MIQCICCEDWLHSRVCRSYMVILTNWAGGGDGWLYALVPVTGTPFKICESFKYNAWYIKFVV